MYQKIEASLSELHKQAPNTIHGYMQDSIEKIDIEFGEGYAKQNPILVGMFMNACSRDLSASILAVSVQNLSDNLVRAIEDIKDNQ